MPWPLPTITTRRPHRTNSSCCRGCLGRAATWMQKASRSPCSLHTGQPCRVARRRADALWCSRHIPPGGGLGERGWGGKACAALLRRNSFDGGGPQDPAATSPTETRRHLAPAFAPSISWMQARPATWTASSTPLPSSWSCWRVVKLQVSPLPWPELGLQRHESLMASASSARTAMDARTSG